MRSAAWAALSTSPPGASPGAAAGAGFLGFPGTAAPLSTGVTASG